MVEQRAQPGDAVGRRLGRADDGVDEKPARELDSRELQEFLCLEQGLDARFAEPGVEREAAETDAAQTVQRGDVDSLAEHDLPCAGAPQEALVRDLGLLLRQERRRPWVIRRGGRLYSTTHTVDRTAIADRYVGPGIAHRSARRL
ncbi:hypothetical protein ACFQ2B_00890 [Streptomyces stramineus]